eukprot:m.76111 g.76111  ORF g.76111 m.76111 type:complete len:51 (+) comp11867_c1_seq3:577-729(+)
MSPVILVYSIATIIVVVASDILCSSLVFCFLKNPCGLFTCYCIVCADGVK